MSEGIPGGVSLQELWELISKCWTEDYSQTFKQKAANSGTVASGEGRPWPRLTPWFESTGREIRGRPPTQGGGSRNRVVKENIGCLIKYEFQVTNNFSVISTSQILHETY